MNLADFSVSCVRHGRACGYTSRDREKFSGASPFIGLNCFECCRLRLTDDVAFGGRHDDEHRDVTGVQSVVYLVDSPAFASCQRLQSRGHDVINVSAAGGFAVVPHNWLRPGPNYLIGKYACSGHPVLVLKATLDTAVKGDVL